jgi:hypothetical protein
VGDRVRVEVLETLESEANREFNQYIVAGQSRFGWIWLTLDKFYSEDDTTIDVIDGAQYDGYNGDILMSHAGGDFWDFKQGDERCALNFHRGPFRLVKVKEDESWQTK